MDKLMTLGLILTMRDLVSRPLQGVLGKLDGLKRVSTHMIAAGAASKIAGGQMMAAMRGPIGAFAEAEDAATRLKAAMLLTDGSIAPEFAAVNRLATELGNKLPGTTADFQNMMTTLAQQGVSYQGILGGIGKSAAFLGVALKLPFDDAARFAARLGAATGTAEKDMLALMDSIQRTANLGVAVDEMGFAFGRSAGKMKEVRFQGLEASKELSVLFAQMIKTGLSGETVGTGMASVVSGLQRFQFGLSKSAVAAKDDLAKLGIQMDFFDKQGQFRGVENLLANLEKLKGLSAAKRAGILTDLFGTGQDAQMVATMIDKGVAGYRKTLERMNVQADLQAKVNLQLGTLANLWDAASGTFTNAMAAFAGALAPQLKALTEGFAAFSEKLVLFIEQHPLLAKMAGGFVAFGGAALSVGGTVALGLGIAMKALGPLTTGMAFLGKSFGLPLRAGQALAARIPLWIAALKSYAASAWAAANGGLKSLPGLFRAKAVAMKQATLAGLAWTRTNLFTLAGLRGLAAAGWAKIVGGIRTVTLALRGMALAALTNPLVWIAAAIAGAALLIFKYWKPIAGFFRGVWAGLKAGLAPLAPAFKAAFAPLAPLLSPVIQAFKAVWGWLKSLIKPVNDTGGAAEAMGRRFGLALAGIIRKGVELVKSFAGMVVRFVAIGRQMIDGLMAGIRAGWAKLKAGIGKLGGNIVGTFKGMLGIRSPSTVFAGLGNLLAAGLEVGMLGGAGRIKGAAGVLAAASIPKIPAPARVALAGIQVPAVASFPRVRGAGPDAGPNLERPRGARPGAGGGVVIHFNPTINVNGGDADKTRAAVQDGLKLTVQELKRVQGQVLHGSARTGYA